MRAVQLSKPGMIEGAASGEFGCAVSGLLGEGRKPDADQPADPPRRCCWRARIAGMSKQLGT